LTAANSRKDWNAVVGERADLTRVHPLHLLAIRHAGSDLYVKIIAPVAGSVDIGLTAGPCLALQLEDLSDGHQSLERVVP
jgi:hypothetical protein